MSFQASHQKMLSRFVKWCYWVFHVCSAGRTENVVTWHSVTSYVWYYSAPPKFKVKVCVVIQTNLKGKILW